MVIWGKSAYDLHSSRWHFQTHWTIECRWAHLKRRWTCTSHINLMGFYPLLLQYSRYRSALGLIYLRSLAGSTFVLRYYSLKGRHCYSGRAILLALLCVSSLVYASYKKQPVYCSWDNWYSHVAEVLVQVWQQHFGLVVADSKSPARMLLLQ